jgi:hypothetical protein
MRMAGANGVSHQAATHTHQVLVVHADAQVVVALDHAVQRLQLPSHELQQRRLALRW